MNIQEGSIWRKWDLHVHTPGSIKHWSGCKRYRDMNQEEKDVETRKIIEKINQTDLAVLAIMDYWTFDGYFEIVDFLKRNKDIICNATILPGIELRVEASMKDRLNIHAILSNELSKQDIMDFKSKLQILYKDSTRTLSDEALISFAKTLDAGKAKIHQFDDPATLDENSLLELGFNTVEISRSSLEEAKNLYHDKCLIMLPYDTHGGAVSIDWENHPPIDNYYMQMAHIFEARSKDNIDLFLGKKTSKNEKFINDFQKTIGGTPKPVVSGSDAHRLSDYGKFPNGKITWIKADPTFMGLRQILISPNQRTFIGNKPEQLEKINNNKTKYIKAIEINRKVENEIDIDIDIDAVWFENISIIINKGLVGIIGNKGMGKSALADIIGFLGNSQRGEHFSFLNKDKFIGADRKRGLAKDFEAKIVWEDGTNIKRDLNAISDVNKSELIRYVPQNFFDKICNETELKKDGEFTQELEKIIYSHVEEFRKDNCNNLQELISNQISQFEKAIDSIKANLSETNRKIEYCENQISEKNKTDIAKEISTKEIELSSLKKSKPQSIEKNKNDEDISNEIEKIREAKSELQKKAEEVLDQQKKNEKQIQAMKRVKASVAELIRNFEKWKLDTDDDLKIINLDTNQLLQFQIINETILDTREVEYKNEADKLSKTSSDISSQICDYTEKEKELTSNLDEKSQIYETYITELSTWEENVKKKEKEIKNLEDKISHIEHELPLEISDLYDNRDLLLQEIINQKDKISDVYSSLYNPIKKFIEDHSEVINKYGLSFDVQLDIDSKFFENFFDYIKQNVSGSFNGKSEGLEYLKQILSEFEINDKNQIKAFIEKIVDALNNNYQKTPVTKSDISTQLRNKTLSEFYDYLYGIDYIEPRFLIKLDNKELPKLSPGERGILLLIFYLLIDNEQCPLIIDQPEENLDNQTIVELLVPCIEEAKNNRQIILVTHNPNLAVVCDADQIIHAVIDKENGNEVSYSSGSIENPEINRKIVDILEGTWKAFHKRESMYQIDSRILYTQTK